MNKLMKSANIPDAHYMAENSFKLDYDQELKCEENKCKICYNHGDLNFLNLIVSSRHDTCPQEALLKATRGLLSATFRAQTKPLARVPLE